MVAEDGLREEVVHELVGRVLVHRDLLEHYLALGVDVRKERHVDHVAHHVERTLEVVVGDAHVDDGVLAGRGRVQLAPERVEGLGNLLRAVGLRALEKQVLDEVGNAGAGRRLVPRTGPDPEAERHRAYAREALRDHTQARVELGEDVLLHDRIVVVAGTESGA
jgi:hypothetical protein